MSSPFKAKRVLITGTTSGLGLSFLRLYYAQGHEIIAVNRRKAVEFEALYPRVDFKEIDISDSTAVEDLVSSLKAQNKAPDVFVLNAGINQMDNEGGLDYESFERVIRTNLLGVMSFVGAIQKLRLSQKQIVALSSTSNLIPNPAHVGYFVSKKALFDSFKLLQRRDPQNIYQTIILGPVATNIMKGYPPPKGLQAILLKNLQVSSERAAERCLRFIESRKSVLYYPIFSCVFYSVLRPVLKLFPKLYGGSVRAPSGLSGAGKNVRHMVQS